jgi:hypothetical protein
MIPQNKKQPANASAKSIQGRHMMNMAIAAFRIALLFSSEVNCSTPESKSQKGHNDKGEEHQHRNGGEDIARGTYRLSPFAIHLAL